MISWLSEHSNSSLVANQLFAPHFKVVHIVGYCYHKTTEAFHILHVAEAWYSCNNGSKVYVCASVCSSLFGT